MKTRLVILFAIIATALRAQGTFRPEFPPEPNAMYKVYVACAPEESATVSTTGAFKVGKEITMNCSANSSDYRFVKWTLDGVDYSTSQSFKYTVPAKESYFVAHFIDIKTISAPVTLLSEPAKAGTFNIVSGKLVEQGSSITIYAYPTQSAYKFLGWYDGANKIGDETSYDFTMPTPSIPTTFTAKWKFEPGFPSEPNAVTFYEIKTESLPAEGGNVLGGGTFRSGAKINLSAVPSEGWEFVEWQDGVTTPNRSVTVSEDATYSATFKNVAALYKTLTFKSSTKSACSFNRTNGELVPIGENVTLTVYNNSNYLFLGWFDGDNKVSDTKSYTFDMPNKDYDLLAKFKYAPGTPAEPNLDSGGTDPVDPVDPVDPIDPGTKPIDPDKIDVSTIVFRTIRGKGLEFLTKYTITASLYDDNLKLVKTEEIEKHKVVELQPGTYTMNISVKGQMVFKKIPVVVKE